MAIATTLKLTKNNLWKLTQKYRIAENGKNDRTLLADNSKACELASLEEGKCLVP